MGRWPTCLFAKAHSAQLHPVLQTRRSMVFAKHLRVAGDEFRNKFLNSSDTADAIPTEEDWTKLKVHVLSLQVQKP